MKYATKIPDVSLDKSIILDSRKSSLKNPPSPIRLDPMNQTQNTFSSTMFTAIKGAVKFNKQLSRNDTLLNPTEGPHERRFETFRNTLLFKRDSSAITFNKMSPRKSVVLKPRNFGEYSPSKDCIMMRLGLGTPSFAK